MAAIELAIYTGGSEQPLKRPAKKIKFNVVDEGIMEVLPGHQETIALGKGGSLEIDDTPVAIANTFLVTITHGTEVTKMVIVAPEITG